MNNRSVTEKPMEIFKILYMVIASLALTCGLERFWLNDERQLILPSDWQSWILFIIFVTTVVRFAHGAMKYLDRMLDDETTVIRLWPIFEGFGVLAIEALFFFLLAF